MSWPPNANAFDVEVFFEQITEILNDYPSSDYSKDARIVEVEKVVERFMNKFRASQAKETSYAMRKRYETYGCVLYIPLVLELDKSKAISSVGTLRVMCGYIAASKPQFYATQEVFHSIATLLEQAYTGRASKVHPLVRLNACAPAAPAPAAGSGGKNRAIPKRTPILDDDTRTRAINYLRKQNVDFLMDDNDADDQDAVNYETDRCIQKHAANFEYIAALFANPPSDATGAGGSSGAVAGPASAVRPHSSKKLPLLTEEQRNQALIFLSEHCQDPRPKCLYGDEDSTDSSGDEESEYQIDKAIRIHARKFSFLASLFAKENDASGPPQGGDAGGDGGSSAAGGVADASALVASSKQLPLLTDMQRAEALRYLNLLGYEFDEVLNPDDQEAENYRMDCLIRRHTSWDSLIAALFADKNQPTGGLSDSSKPLPLLTVKQRAEALGYLNLLGYDLVEVRNSDDDNASESSDDEEAENFKEDCLIRLYARHSTLIAALFAKHEQPTGASSASSGVSAKRAAPDTSVAPAPVVTKCQKVVTDTIVSGDKGGSAAQVVPALDPPDKDFSRALFSALQSCSVNAGVRKAELKRILTKMFDSESSVPAGARSFFVNDGFDEFFATVQKCQQTYLAPFFSTRSYLIRTSKSFYLKKEQIELLVNYLATHCIHHEDKDPEH